MTNVNKILLLFKHFASKFIRFKNIMPFCIIPNSRKRNKFHKCIFIILHIISYPHSNIIIFKCLDKMQFDFIHDAVFSVATVLINF